MTLDGTVFNRRQRDYPPINGIIPNYHLLPVDCAAEGEDAWLVTRTRSSGITIYQHARLLLAGAEMQTSSAADAQAVQEIVFTGRAGVEVGFDKFMAVYTTREMTEEEADEPPSAAEMRQLAGTLAIIAAE